MLGVIFDMDGTLLDTQRICIPAWEYAGRQQGIIGMGDHIVNVCGMNHYGSDNYIVTNFPSVDLEKFREDSRNYIIENLVVRFKEGAGELLELLRSKKIKIGLATGTSRPSTMHHLKEVGIEDYFDAIVCGTEVENGKPAPDIFLRTAQIMGVEPRDCYVFEDSANGIKAGFLAGMKCVGIADIVPFTQEVKSLMYREYSSMKQAIEIFNGN